jgi:hypothetical protein
MKTCLQWFSQPLVLALALLSSVSTLHAQEGFLTEVEPYISPTSRGNYMFRQVLSVGDQIPLAGSATGKYQLPQVIAGLGGYRATIGTKPVIKLLIGNPAVGTAEPIVGGTAFRGSFVSEITLSTDGSVLSGAPAYDTVWNENTLLGPTQKVNNATPAFGLVTGLKVAGPENGLDRQIAFVSTRGGDLWNGASIAIFDREAHLLPKFGNFWKSTHVVQTRTDNLSVVFPLHLRPPSEDGPRCYLFMFVGTMDTRAYRPAMRKNGLDNGRLFVLMSGSGQSRVRAGLNPLNCRWVAVPDEVAADPWQMDEIFAASNPLVVFDGLVSGAFDKTNPNRLFFGTQGQVDETDNPNQVGLDGGRLYEITLATDPRQNCVLRTVFPAGSRAKLISPGEVETRGDYLFLAEDQSIGPVGPDGNGPLNGLWSFKISDGLSALHEGQLDRVPLPGTGPSDLGIGTYAWNIGGLIDASTLLNRPDAFFVTANIDTAFAFPGARALNVRLGQLLLMFKTDL